MRVSEHAWKARVAQLSAEVEILRDRLSELTGREDAIVNRLKLSQREFRVAHYLAERAPYTCRKDQLLIARNGWSLLDNVDVDTKMVDVMICKIRKRLKSRGIIIETDWGVGYRMTSKGAAKFMKLAYEVEEPHLKIGQRSLG